LLDSVRPLYISAADGQSTGRWKKVMDFVFTHREC
jgi:hypothetical protein